MLTEIPRGLSADQLAGREPLAGPVPPGDEIEQAFARQVADLPPATGEALVLAAAMQTGRHDVFLRALARRGLPADALEPALRAELVSVDGRVDFFHPLLRSAVYHAADPVQRRSVHATLAELSSTGARARRLLEAASDFAQSGQPDHALALVGEAPELVPGDGDRPRPRPHRDAPRRDGHRARPARRRGAQVEAREPHRAGELGGDARAA